MAELAIHEIPVDDRYGVVCWFCDSLTWFDNDEEVPLMCECWRCGEIINGDL